MIVDAHTHIFEENKDISRYLKAGILPVLTGHSDKANRLAFGCAQKYGVPFVVGIAPQTAQTEGLAQLEEWEKFIKQCGPHAIGETGIDNHWARNEKDRKLQAQSFSAMVELAKDMGLPLVIHSRESFNEVVDFMAKEKFKGKVMFHFFGEDNPEYALERLDAYFSFPPLSSARREKALKKIPAERIMAETDSPYVGKTPLDVEKSVMIIAKEKKMEYKEAAELASRNAFKFFGIDAY
jgi:TatD DNase family protein